jgi:hypothetical protein
VGEAEGAQQAFRAFVHVVYHGFDTVQRHLGESAGERGAQGLAHDALPPIRAVQFIARLGALKGVIEMEEAA